MQHLQPVDLIEKYDVLATGCALCVVVIARKARHGNSARQILARLAQNFRVARDDGEAVVVVVFVADGYRVANKVVQFIARVRIARVGQNGITAFAGKQKTGVSIPSQLHKNSFSFI